MKITNVKFFDQVFMHFSTTAIQIQKIIFIDYRTVFCKQTHGLITQHAQSAAPDVVISRKKRALQMNDKVHWPKAGEGKNRGQDGWLASPTQATWVSASSRRWWRTEKPGVLQSMRFQRAGYDWEDWTVWQTCWLYKLVIILSMMSFVDTKQDQSM